MADIRCPRCGENNPDFFDVCQFCQAPLKSDAMLHTGDAPQKVDTGELEPILPDWLQDVRQQSRDVTADDAFRSTTRPKVQKNEVPDLLAGLTSQVDSNEDEVPDWLAGINPVADKKTSSASSNAKQGSSDFFAQFEKKESQPSAPPPHEPEQEKMPDWMGGFEQQPAAQKDELSDWLAQTPAETSVPSFGEDKTSKDDHAWMNNIGSFTDSQPEPPAEKAPEDLGWLHNLEAASRQTGDLSSAQPKEAFDFGATQPESSQEDLSWLDSLGRTTAPSFEAPEKVQPASSQEDLSWLDNLSGTSFPSFEETPTVQPSSSQDDLSWLNDLGGTPAPSFEEASAKPPSSSQDDLSWLNNLGGTLGPSFEKTPTKQPSSSQEDLGWLNNLGGTSAPSIEETPTVQPSSSQEDLSWLNNLGREPVTPNQPTPSASQDDLDWLKSLGDQQGVSESLKPSGQYTPPRTAPLSESAMRDSTPDWLKSAMKESSMPPPGAVSMDWFSEHKSTGKPESVHPQMEFSKPGVDKAAGPTRGGSDSDRSGLDLPKGESSIPARQDVDSLFQMDMPDWLSQEPGSVEGTVSDLTPPFISGEEALAPVELPSWVQAMRPVDSVIEETSASEEQVTEQEGPLAGFRGVIPLAPIGSALRPKAFSLKLQVTEEQQAGASLIEQIVTNESITQPKKNAAFIASQRMLRWALTLVFLGVLSLVLVTGMQTMPIFASATVTELSTLISAIPESSPVLVVVDYEPSLAGELEAAAGPVFDQLAMARHSTFTFISMSPNGVGMVDRLMSNTNVTQPLPAGAGYQPGVQYFNLGFLPGGSAGVLGFIENPMKVMPRVNVDGFSRFEAVIILTDDVETGSVWVEQLEIAKGRETAFFNRPLFVVSSAQSGPMLQPYVSSGQVDVMISGIYDAVQYEYVNNTRPGIARSYWDAFGVGLMMAILAIVLGSIWNVFMGIRVRRTEAEQG